MTIILSHGDGDGICSAAIIKMTEKYKEAKVIITHPIGFANDLRDLDEELVISDIALDMRGYEEIYGELEAISSRNPVLYIDHHRPYGPLPSNVEYIYREEACSSELVYRYFYHELPKIAIRIACIGAICDYMDNTPLMQELIIQFERRGLFLDAGLLSQGLNADQKNYEYLRKLIKQFSEGFQPNEVPSLVSNAISTCREDKINKHRVLKMYQTEKNLAWVENPPASKSKAAHWIMGDSHKLLGLTVIHREIKPNVVDITIRGRNSIDLRDLVPTIALNLGGSGGGLSNAIGCRIPKDKLPQFLKILDNAVSALNAELPPDIANLVKLF